MSCKPGKTLELLTPAASPAPREKGDGYQPFPVDALPAAVGAFVREGAGALGCDPACLALPVLAVVAGAIGNARTIRLKEGTHEPCVIWSAVVGDGGTGIAAALRTALAHLLSRQKEAFLSFRILREQYAEALKSRRDRRRQAVDLWAGLLDESPKGPVLQWLVCGQTAIDKLARILEQNPRGLLVARQELNGWLASFLRVSGATGGRDPSLWQEMHRAGSFYVERTRGDRGLCFVPRAAVSLTGVLSPEILSRVLRADVPGRGLAACFLLAMPPRSPMVWSPGGIDGATEGAFNELLDRLLRLELEDSGNERVPHVLTLSSQAAAEWAEFYNARQAEQAAAEGALTAALVRLEGYAARFALIDHIVRCVRGECGDPAVVGSESIEAGVTLCRWFTAEARRVYSKLFESAEERNAAVLVGTIRRRGGRITVRELMRTYAQHYPDAATAEAALARLVELGLGRWIESRQKKLTG
jgi:hypothetical protein